MASSYMTGGPVPGKAGKYLPGPDASECSVDAASEGTANDPNARKWATTPGGHGSSGSASSSKPR